MGRERALQALLLALTFAGCDRAPAKGPATVEATTTGPTKIAVPTEGAPILPAEPAPTIGSAPATGSEPAPETGSEPAPETGSAPGTASSDPRAAKLPPSRKGKGPDPISAAASPTTKNGPAPSSDGSVAPAANPPAPSTPATPPAPSAPATPFTPKTLVTEKLFRIELAPLAACKPATTCEAYLLVHSLGGYKVNAEYPTKFVAKASPGIAVEGTGTFGVTEKTIGKMTLKLRATAAGTAKISGALKLNVCTEEICEIAAPVVSFDVIVTPG